MEQIVKYIVPLLNTKDVASLWVTNKTMFEILLEYMESKRITHHKYLLQCDIDHMNVKAKIINNMSSTNQIAHNIMFEYLILCYKHWFDISNDQETRKKLIIPTSNVFDNFMNERGVTMEEVFPTPKYIVWHYDNHTRKSRYYATII